MKELAERIQKQVELDDQRRKERERANLTKIDETDKQPFSGTKFSKAGKKEPVRVMERISEYEQFRKPISASKLKLKSGIEAKLESKLLPPFPSQPLPKLPSEYDQFRKPASNRSHPRSQSETNQTSCSSQTSGITSSSFVRNPPSEYEQVPPLEDRVKISR